MAKIGPAPNLTACVYIHIYMLWSSKLVQNLRVFVLKIGPKIVLKLVQNVSLFLPILWCFGGMLKAQIMSIGAKIVFSQNCRDVKNEVFEKKIAFLPFFSEKDKPK